MSNSSGGQSACLAFYVMVAGAISFIGVLFVEEQAGGPLPDEIPLAPIFQGSPA